MFKNEDKLNPPPYVPSETEIQLAKINAIFDDAISDNVSLLIYYFKYKETGENPWNLEPKNIVQNAQVAMTEWSEAMDNYNGDLVAAFDPNDHYKFLVDGLSSMHIGDCTAHPATCVRCYCEEQFKIPYTANWTKSEGFKMWREYTKDKESNNVME